MIYAERIISGLNGFYHGHFQNTPNIKTLFGYAGFKRFDMLYQNAELEPAVQCVDTLVSEKSGTFPRQNLAKFSLFIQYADSCDTVLRSRYAS